MTGILKRIKALIQENSDNQKQIISQTKELEWASVYHDSIRGKKHLEELSLNIGRWAGNYTFFYILNRILKDFKPKSILELGLGESTKFISTYLDNYLIDTTHMVIEQDQNWKNLFEENFTLSQKTKVTICPSEKLEVKGFETNVYKDFDKTVSGKFDFYLVDGPNGSYHYSRYDIVKLASNFKAEDQFIIMIDDYDRQGERETVMDLRLVFDKQNIRVFENIYEGNKSVLVIATEEYKYATSL